MEFLKHLGFDPIMLGAQILNFAIIFFLLKRFLYKPVMDMVKTREDKITQGLKEAEQARLKLEEATEEEKKILTKAQSQAKELLEESKKQALANASVIEEEANKRAERLLEETKSQLFLEALEIERKLAEKTSIIAVEMLTKSLKGLLKETEQRDIVAKAIKSMKGLN